MSGTDELSYPRAGDLDRPESSHEHERRHLLGITPLVALVLALIVLLGGLVRVTGWTGGGLFFDDAWVALPARVPLSTAFHMWFSSPGYTLFQRQWTLISPNDLRWVLAPTLILGVLAPVVAFALGRVLRFPDWIALTMAGFVAVEPCAIQYSAAVKPFEFDLVTGMVLLGFVEFVRRHRTVRTLTGMAALSVLAVFMDVSLLIVVVGIWSALLLITYLDSHQRSATLVCAGATGLIVVPAALSIQQEVPPFDVGYFRNHGALVGPPYSFDHLFAVFIKTGGGLAHGMFATPTQFFSTSRIPTSTGISLAAATLVEVAVFVVLAKPAVKAWVRRRPDDPAMRQLASVLVVVVAVLAYLVGKVPLGDGRNDLVVVPAIMVLLASGLERLTATVRSRTSAARASRLGAVAAIVVGLAALSLAWDVRAWYPTQALKALDQKVVERGGSSDVVVITFRNSYTWAYDGLSSFRVHFSTTSIRSLGVGYWVTFPSSKVLIGDWPGIPGVPGLPELPSTDRRLWLIGTTLLNASPSVVHYKRGAAAAGLPLPSTAPSALTGKGWHATSTRLAAPGVYADLYIRG